MASKRFIVKYDRHHDRYGVHDRAESECRWIGDLAAAASQAVRLNAVEEIGASLNGAISAIGLVLTGQLAPARREEYRSLREQLRDLRDELPDVESVATELARHDADEAGIR